MILTKKMSVLKRTVAWLVAVAVVSFILMIMIIIEFQTITSHWYEPSVLLVILFFTGVALVFAMVIMAFHSFTKPMHELTENALKVADGNYDVHFNIDKYDVEWQFLMNVFNQMSTETQRKIEQLNLQHKELLTYKDQIEELNQRLSEKIEIKSQQLQKYIDTVDQYVITSQTDINGIITYVSKAFCEISGYTKGQLVGNNHRIIRHPDMPSVLFDDLWKTISSGKIWHGEIKNRKADGGHYWVNTMISPNVENGKIIGYTAVRHDITHQKRVEELSVTDSMTGLYNRRYYAETIKKEMNRVKRHSSSLGLMMIDVDNFKLYNDTYGHQAGDKVLMDVAGILKEYTSRSGEYAFRLGGEEFAILVSGMKEEEYIDLGNRICVEIEKMEIPHRNNDISTFVTISMGIALYDSVSEMTCEELYKEADIQLYKAKNNGRNRVMVQYESLI